MNDTRFKSTDTLANRFPDVAKEWDYEKNGSVTPRDIPPRSGKEYYFRCVRNHSYRVSLHLRTQHELKKPGSGCPYCTSHRVCSDNSLAAKFPEIAKEWDYSRNGGVTPNDVMPSAHKKYWFLCSKAGHSFEARLDSRQSQGCTYCRFKTQEEVRQIFERVFRTEFKESRPKFLGKLSLDGYSDRLKLAFEYDGEFHDVAHYKAKDPEEYLKAQKLRDARKNELCTKSGVVLIRIHHSNKNNIEETVLKELEIRQLLPKETPCTTT